jgi:hypothetical protein
MSDRYAEKRVVWILGSGFSKSLGGPLLNDLLSYRGEAFVKAKFPNLDRATYDLYRRHLRDHPKNLGQPVYWDHAEEFLDFVSTATREGSKERYDILLESLYPEPTFRALLTTKDPNADVLQKIRTNTVRCLAGECLFTTHTSTRAEGWRPYIAWAKALRPYDTIISFNYDMVLEKLATEIEARENLDHPLRFGADSVLAPHRADEDLPSGRTVRILKLHGSVGWFSYGDNAFVTALTDAAAAEKLIENTMPYVLGPGPDKLLHQEGTFKKLWGQAARHLTAADVIVFLGYRFPPSDSQSRDTLLRAIGLNESKYLRIHTVLGPTTNEPDTVRLSKLLEHTLRGVGRVSNDAVPLGHEPMDKKWFQIAEQPLYVEDFLTVLNDKELYNPRWPMSSLAAPS